jgi:hypothetical protein
MPRYLWVSAILALLLGAGVAGLRGDAEPKVTPERIAALIEQLGDNNLAQREAASTALEAIGAPALDALRRAAANADPEIRRRAGQITQTIAARLLAAAAKKELSRWEGEWYGNGNDSLLIKGDRWLWGHGQVDYQQAKMNQIKIVEVGEKATAADLLVVDGETTVRVCRAILRLEGDTLQYCGTYDPVRPTEFKSAGNHVYVAWKRGKNPNPPPPPPPVISEFDCPAFSLDLMLAESKQAIHRIHLKCQLVDGGKATLILDPTVPKFNEFGEPIAGKPLDPVTLDGTMKLVKKDDKRQLFAIRGPKITSRLYLAVHKDTLPWGDGRLMVHGDNGEVRRLIELSLPHQLRFPPCHPGCFPAGTLIRVPDGTKSIERIREGDLVTILDVNGKASSSKVTSVFATRNRLLELRAGGVTLATTETQPLALEVGGFRPAGELKPGDRIWRWVDGQRRAALVQTVSPPNREAEVFNLVLGEPTAFIASDFLVRSKPPAVPLP